MPEYTVKMTVGADGDRTPEIRNAKKEFLEKVSPFAVRRSDFPEEEFFDVPGTLHPVIVGAKVLTSVSYGFEMTVQARCLQEALQNVSYAMRRSHRGGFKFDSWSGWYSEDVIYYAGRRIRRRYTAAEIANPDLILLSVPEVVPVEDIHLGDGTIATGLMAAPPSVTQTARRRYQWLLRYKMAIQFAQANPGLSFHPPDGWSGVSKLALKDCAIVITFSANRHRMHVKGSELSGLDEWILPTDTHGFQALVAHEKAVCAEADPVHLAAQAGAWGNPGEINLEDIPF